MLGIHVLFDPVGEGVVDRVPLVHHGRGTLVQQLLNPVARQYMFSITWIMTMFGLVTRSREHFLKSTM